RLHAALQPPRPLCHSTERHWVQERGLARTDDSPMTQPASLNDQNTTKEAGNGPERHCHESSYFATKCATRSHEHRSCLRSWVFGFRRCNGGLVNVNYS